MIRQRFNESIQEIAHKFSKFPGLKLLLKPFYYKFKDYNKKKQNNLFHKYGLEALRQFDKCMEANSFVYVLAFGSMLGAIRERGFIKHDLDIDVSMFIEDHSDKLKECLTDYGFNLSHVFLIDNGACGREETYSYKGVHIDVFFFYPPIGKYPYCCDFLMKDDTATFRESMSKARGVLPRRIELPISRERKRVQFENILLPVPSNAEEILEFRYGQDYMIPNTKWDVNSHDEHIVEWNEKNGIFIDYE